jgi:hypothetical protein
VPAPRITRARAEPAPNESLLNRVEAARVTRNRAEYQAREVTETELTDLEGAAHSLVVAARAHVSLLQVS